MLTAHRKGKATCSVHLHIIVNQTLWDSQNFTLDIEYLSWLRQRLCGISYTAVKSEIIPNINNLLSATGPYPWRIYRFSPADIFWSLCINFRRIWGGGAPEKPSKMFQNCFCTFYILTCTDRKSMAVRALSNFKIHALCSPSNLTLVYTRYSTGLEIRPIISFKRKIKERKKSRENGSICQWSVWPLLIREGTAETNLQPTAFLNSMFLWRHFKNIY